MEQLLEARPGFLQFQVRLQLAGQNRIVGERKIVRVGLEKKVEGIDRRHVGGELDLDLELVGLFGKGEPGLEIAQRVLLPVDEMLFRRDAERVIQDRRPALGRGTQADDLGPQRHLAVVLIMGDVSERDVNGHGAIERG